MTMWFFSFVDFAYYIYWFVDVEPPFHSWDEFHLILLYKLFDNLLPYVCQFCTEDFSIYIYQRDWLVILFFGCHSLMVVLG